MFVRPRPLVAALVAALVLNAGALRADVPNTFADAAETRAALAQAQAEGATAQRRAEMLEQRAAGAVEQADKTAAEAAAVAARIQQAEADIAAAEARLALIERHRVELRATLAARQQPVVRLTAALERLSRRPLGLSLLQPGSIADAVHTRALMATMVPEVRARTASLREALARTRDLAAQARQQQVALRGQQIELSRRKQALAAIETRQRLAARDVAGSADREAERALALSERTRDLGGLVDTLGAADAERAVLARLPGPVLRPERPGAPPVEDVAPIAPSTGAPAGYLLPAAGRLVSGFVASGGTGARGIVLAVRGGAQVVAPGAGRVAFAGPYRGYGMIAIVAHDGGWTSLVTGMNVLQVRVGDGVVAGSPLGTAGPGQPMIGLELRHAGQPVNPLDLVAGR